MFRFRSLSLLFALTLIAPLSVAENKTEEAAALVARAKQLSDIRAADSPPFRLKANIMIVSDDGGSDKGTYVETWASQKCGALKFLLEASSRRKWQKTESYPF